MNGTFTQSTARSKSPAAPAGTRTITLVRLRAFALLATACCAALVSPSSFAQKMYKCIDAGGKTFYTQTPPKECLGRTVNELDKRGNVTRQDEALTPEQQAAREADRKKKHDAEVAAKDQRRRDTALLDTYASEKDIDDAHGRALRAPEQVIKQIEQRIADSGKSKMTESELKNQQALLDAKKKEYSAISARYDDEKKRFGELTRAAKR